MISHLLKFAHVQFITSLLCKITRNWVKWHYSLWLISTQTFIMFILDRILVYKDENIWCHVIIGFNHCWAAASGSQSAGRQHTFIHFDQTHTQTCPFYVFYSKCGLWNWSFSQELQGVGVILACLECILHQSLLPTQIRLTTLIARFMGPTRGLSGASRTQVGHMLAPWTLLSG